MELTDIKGVGPKMLTTLKKIGINSVYDMITHYPFRYNILKKTDMSKIEDDSYVVTDGVVETIPYVVHFKKNMDKMSFKLNDGKKIINVVIFNRGFYKAKLSIGTTITLIGRYDVKHNTCVASELRFGALPPNPVIEPVYHTTFGLSSKEFSKLLNNSLSNMYSIRDDIIIVNGIVLLMFFLKIIE